MRNYYQQLYHDMMQDIDRCMHLELPEKERAESCFWIAHNYWEKLKDLMRNKDFENEEAEIEFFRNMKPKITSQIEYFARLSEALFSAECSNTGKEELLQFWEGETDRLERFVRRNETFISYYESGERYGDNMYFLRCNNYQGPTITAPPYDTEMEFCSSHDQVLRSYLALKMYDAHVRGKIESLSMDRQTQVQR